MNKMTVLSNTTRILGLSVLLTACNGNEFFGYPNDPSLHYNYNRASAHMPVQHTTIDVRDDAAISAHAAKVESQVATEVTHKPAATTSRAVTQEGPKVPGMAPTVAQ